MFCNSDLYLIIYKLDFFLRKLSKKKRKKKNTRMYIFRFLEIEFNSKCQTGV